jgi:putative tricarboxylic transport membrane protein
MNSLINRDTISGLLLFLLAAGYLHLTKAIPSSSLSDEVGADGLPRLLASGLFIVSALIMAKGILGKGAKTKTEAESRDSHGDRASLLRALGFVAIGAGYIVLAPVMGFALGIAGLMVAVAVYEGERLSIKVLSVAGLTGLGFWAVFVKGLGTEQPASWLLQRLTGA